MTPEVKRIQQWLSKRLRDTTKSVDEAARARDFGEAERREGIADAYHYTLENLERVAEGAGSDHMAYLPAKGRRE